MHVHNSISLIVSGSKSCSEWAVDWNLMVVGSKTMSMGVSVVDKSALKHLVVGSLNSWNEVSRSKSCLLSLCMEILGISVECESSNLL